MKKKVFSAGLAGIAFAASLFVLASCAIFQGGGGAPSTSSASGGGGASGGGEGLGFIYSGPKQRETDGKFYLVAAMLDLYGVGGYTWTVEPAGNPNVTLLSGVDRFGAPKNNQCVIVVSGANPPAQITLRCQDSAGHVAAPNAVWYYHSPSDATDPDTYHIH